jgi:hypothetical protein
MGAAAVYDWLKLDRVLSSQLRVRGWEKEPSGAVAGGCGAHAAVELALIESGDVKYTIGGRDTFVRAGDVMIVPHEVEHVTTFLTPMRGVALWLGADMVREVLDTMGPGVANAMLAPGTLDADSRRIQTLLRLAVGELSDARPGHSRAVESLCEAVVIEMLRSAPR